MRISSTFVLSATLLAAACGGDSPQVSTLSPALSRSVDSLFSRFDNQSSPGCALTILEGDEVLYRRGYGMANLEHGIPIDSRSLFRTGSVSKQFTAAVILLLAEDGVLSLDDALNRYLPEMPTFGYEITLRHLLHHTSGIRDYLDLMALAGRGSDDFYRKEQALSLLARQEGLNFPPGERFLYSNSGYFLLSQVVERATGRTLRTEAQERIFGPLGMSDTHFHDDRNEIVVRRADGYAPLEGGGFEISMTKLDLVGDGGVFTTIEDLGLWLASMERRALGDPPVFSTLLTRGVLNDGSTLGYAMGIGHGTRRGLSYVGHGGAFVGFRAATLSFQDQHTSVGLLCNRSDVDPMGMVLAVADLILAEEMEAAATGGEDEPREQMEREEEVVVSPLPPEDILGVYYSPELDASYELRMEGDRLVMEVDGIRTLPLVFRDAEVYGALFITLRIVRGGEGVVALDATLPRASSIRFFKQ